MIKTMVPSDLDLNDPPHDEMADEEATQSVPEHQMTRRPFDHRHEVQRIPHEQDGPDQEWQRGQYEAGKPPLSRHDAYLAQQLEPFTDRVRGVVEDLGEVAADFLRDEHANHENGQVRVLDPVHQVVECVAHREPQANLLRDLAELPGNRLRKLLCDHLERADEAVPGLQ